MSEQNESGRNVAAANNTSPKVSVQSLNQACGSIKVCAWLDGEVLLNSYLRVAAKRL
jgi:hypothetical protein